jgi:hypothetical protein
MATEGLKCLVDLGEAIRTGKICLQVAGPSSDLDDLVARRCESEVYFFGPEFRTRRPK